MEIRPLIRLVQYNEDGELDAVGDHEFEEFWTVPQVGDVFADNRLGGGIESLEVARRWFIPDRDQGVWYLLVSTNTDGANADVYSLHQEVQSVHAEIQAERSKATMDELVATAAAQKAARQAAQQRRRTHSKP